MFKKGFNVYVLFTILIVIFITNLGLIIINENKWNETITKTINSQITQVHIIKSELDEDIRKIERNFNIIISLFISLNLIGFALLYFYKRKKDKYESMIYDEKEKAFITLNSIGDAVITTDNKGYVTFFNPIAENLTGFKNEEAVGKYIDEVFFLIDLTTKNKIPSPINEVLKNAQITTLAKNTALVSKNNEIYTIEDSAAPIQNQKKQVIGVVLVFHDVTKQKEYLVKLTENEKILIQQSKMASMGEMLGNIAHQWRQPLSVISTSATGLKLKKQLDELDDEFLLSSLDLINKSSQHLSKTIDDFRNFFKPNKKKEHFNILPLYQKTISLLSSKFTNREIEIVEKIEDIEIYGYENELIQVFMNIFNNSLDVLENKVGQKIVFVNIYSENDILNIEILDNGGGILKNVITRVFEPYFTTKHQGQGTGIGLYMTEEIVTKHMNGKVSVKNRRFDYKGLECYGAFFQLEFPIK